MQKNKILTIILVITLVILVAWYLASSFTNNNESNKTTKNNLISQEMDILKLQQSKCQEDGGTWVKDRQFCHVYNEEKAEILKKSCEDLNGTWFSDSRYYECEIDGDLWQYGDWEMVNWETFKDNKESCLESEGKWFGGVDEACEIDDDVFYRGKWMVLDEMEDSCINEFGGEWLGGENTECKIEGVVYPGNWVQIFTLKESCQDSGGTWLGGEGNQCRIGSEIYNNQAWERLGEMKTSCEESGGVFKGGEKFRCDIDNVVYYNKNWERLSKADSMGQSCEASGGSWEAETRTCSGLSLEWCGSINEELELGGLGWREASLSCYIY
ncbi:MAG: hypothetical protein K9M44_03905 [Candidatus Pacebacteria bacterium]|nr:hypothetical protein [Candidatus Paceibacterota bacterium]